MTGSNLPVSSSRGRVGASSATGGGSDPKGLDADAKASNSIVLGP